MEVGPKKNQQCFARLLPQRRLHVLQASRAYPPQTMDKEPLILADSAEFESNVLCFIRVCPYALTSMFWFPLLANQYNQHKKFCKIVHGWT